jgi:hypothetical protein
MKEGSVKGIMNNLIVEKNIGCENLRRLKHKTKRQIKRRINKKTDYHRAASALS